jgi:rhamnulokinase
MPSVEAGCRARFLAVDLGAESGRVLLGGFDGGRMEISEGHRFPNEPVLLPDGLHWNVLGIFNEIQRGVARAASESDGIESLGVDAWGVDFGLLDSEGVLLANPHHYRDERTEGMMEAATRKAPREEIYRTTGIQFMQINTLNQLLAMEGSPVLGAASTLLTIPDLFNYWLTGEIACEYTNATTTQLLDVETGEWSGGLARALGIPERIFPDVIGPGTILGTLSDRIGRTAGLPDGLPVTAVASHDTASAVVAIPASEESFAYISSGTWSLVGMELSRAVVTTEALEANFTNEGGFAGTTRFLKNVMGLWILQECRRVWSLEGREYPYEELVALAERVTTQMPLVDPDHPDLLPAGEMPARIQSLCRQTGQRVPDGPAEISRCVMESLALKYRWTIESAESVTGRRAGTIHVVGGGCRNSLLCRLTAEATRRPVLAGPVEATATGNLMVQAYSRGHVGSLSEIREVVRHSVEVQVYEPDQSQAHWDGAYERFVGIVEAGRSLTVRESAFEGKGN